jgi:hypothetical protein
VPNHELTSAPFRRAQVRDNANHPPSPDQWWQESVLFNLSNPRDGLAGQYRLNIHPNRHAATVYTWTQLDGRMIDRRMVTDLELPGTDLTSASLGGLSITTVAALDEYRLRLHTDDLDLDVSWSVFMPPIHLDYNIAGATVANGHYQSLGRARGELRYRGRTVPVQADGFMDHSWGVRRQHLPGSRWMVAIFDPTFFVMAIPILTDQGKHMVGYVMDQGVLGALTSDYDINMTFRDDWISPQACDATLFDHNGRGYHITGHTVGPSSIQPFGHGKLVTHAPARYECGGRIGRGVLESSSPRSMMPSEIAALNLDPTSWWING